MADGKNPRVCVAYAQSSRRPPHFSPEECNTVIRWAERQRFDAVRFDGSPGAPSQGAEFRRHRQLNIAQPPRDRDIARFCDRLRDLVFALNQQIWQFDLSGIAGVLIAKYETGDAIGLHADLSSACCQRKLVLLVQLSSGDDYRGGALEYGITEPITASRQRGSVVGFPAWMPHRVTPLTSGIRYSALCVGVGPSFR